MDDSERMFLIKDRRGVSYIDIEARSATMLVKSTYSMEGPMHNSLQQVWQETGWRVISLEDYGVKDI